LNIDFGINNERQDCKIGTGWGNTCGRGRVTGKMKVREYGWWASYTHMK
jgi:hypothetical protein